MESEAVIFSFGDETEELLEEYLEELSDTELDKIEIHRDLQELSDLASEPLTATVVIAGTISFTALCATIQRYLEGRRQRTSAKLVMEAFTHSLEAGEAMTELQKKNSDIIRYSPLTQLPLVTGLNKLLTGAENRALRSNKR